MRNILKKGTQYLLAAAIVSGAAGAFLWGASSAPLFAHAAESHEWQHEDGQILTEGTETLADQKYYLSEDITLSQSPIISGNVELCLNGHTLTLSNGATIDVNQATLTLHDCGGDSGQAQGTITGATGSAISVSYGTFIMNGGTITGNGTAENGATEHGGGVSLSGDSSNGTFTMNGGTITNNAAQNGGGVALLGGMFTMNGGEISNNTADYGGGIYAYAQQGGEHNFTVTNGTIRGNTAEHVDTGDRDRVSGGGIYVGEGTKFTLSGGTVTENNSGVYVREPNVSENAATLTVENGVTISNNTIGIELYGAAHLEMTGGTISDNGEFGIVHGGSGLAKNPATATISGGAITGNGVGIGEFEGKLTLANVRITENIGIGVEATFSGVGQPSLEMTECTVENNGGAGVTLGSEYSDPVPFTMQDGSVTGNKGGGVIVNGYQMGEYSAACTLTGAPTIANNTLDGAAANLMLNGFAVSVERLQGGQVGITPGDVGYDGPLPTEVPSFYFTVGYHEGVEEFLSYDGTDGGKFVAKQIEVMDENLSPITPTELVLVYHLSFMINGAEDETLSGDYDAYSYINTLFYDYKYDDQQQVVGTIKPEVEELLVKEPDDTNHYAFSHFSNGQGEPYDFTGETIYRFEGTTVINVEFTATPHAWDDWQDNQDGENHIHYCSSCQYSATEAHDWSAWSDDEDGEHHSRSCQTDGCTATEQTTHDWGEWSDDEDGEHHSRSCQTEGCTATEQTTHDWGAWSDDEDGEHHSRSCQTEGCTATEQTTHDWSAWSDDEDGEHHSRSCQTDGCTATEQTTHDWGAWSDDEDGEHHSRSCQTDGCTATEQTTHDWGAWSDDEDGEHHSRSCQTDGCTATEQTTHDWGAWSDDEDGEHHSRSCQTDGCTATEQSTHDWSAWSDDEDGEHHSRSCQTDGCTATEQSAHDWGAWSDDEDGEHHSRSCQTEGCTATEQELHTWSEWTESEGETLTRDCDDCHAHEVKPDERPVAAVLLRDGVYTPFETLAGAFDSARAGETVYFVQQDGGTALSATLRMQKSVLLGAVIRSVAEDHRAVYTVDGDPIVIKRAAGFEDAMIVIAAGAELRFDRLIIEGGEASAPAVEVYGALTIGGGKIEAICAVRVCAPVTHGIALTALSGDGKLAVTGEAELGTVRLDDPAGGIVPSVDLEGFGGSLKLEITETRPFGAFAIGIGGTAQVEVVGGARWERGLSAREVRLQDGMYVAGGYDLTVKQTALGEVTFTGVCDEYLRSLTVTVNGSPLVLATSGEKIGERAYETGSTNQLDLSVGGRETAYGLVYFDETTGLLTAPEGATFAGSGGASDLNGADPFDLPFNGDSAAVTVGGETRTLDFCNPVGTRFVYRYLSDEGTIFSGVDYTNCDRINEGVSVYERLTARQREFVEEKLRQAGSALDSFEAFTEAAREYVRAQSKEAEKFIENNETLSKDFDSLSGSDSSSLKETIESYRECTEEEKHFLDEQAQELGYSGFEGMLDDMVSKTEFETEKEETLENLGTILRGCDGRTVQEELSVAIQTVTDAVYERFQDDDLRLEYLAGQKESLAAAVRVLENIRAEERVKSALEAYLSEKTENGFYSEQAIASLGEIAAEIASSLGEIDKQSPDGEAQIERLYEEALDRLNAVRAGSVSVEGLPVDEFPEYSEDSPSVLYGILSREEQFAGNCRLVLRVLPLMRAAGEEGEALLRVEVELEGEPLDGEYRIGLLLPNDARGYTEYFVTAQDGTAANVTREGNLLLFDASGREFVIRGQRQIDLSWLIMLLSCLCALETAALLYVICYLFRSRTAAFAPLLAAALIPLSEVIVCATLGAVCLAELIALTALLVRIERRERSDEVRPKRK